MDLNILIILINRNVDLKFCRCSNSGLKVLLIGHGKRAAW